MRKWKRVLSVALAATLAVSLCACGGKKGGSTSGGNVAASAELAKQYVYKMQDIAMDSLTDGTMEGIYTQAVALDGDTVFMIFQGNAQDDNGYYTNQYVYATMNIDGTNFKTTALEPVQVSEEEQEQDQERSQANKKVAAVDVLVEGEEGEVAEESNVYEYTWYNNFTIIDGKYIYAIRGYEYSDYSDSESPIYTRENSVCCWDVDGKVLWNTPVELLNDQENWHYVNYILKKNDGAVTLLITGNETGFVDVDKEGNVSELKTKSNLEDLLRNSASVAAMPDGKIMLSYYDDSWVNLYVATYDAAADKVGESVKLPSSVAYNMAGRFFVDANGNMIFSNAGGVYKYHIGDEKETQMMSYVNSDVVISSFDYIVPSANDDFIGFYTEYDENYNSTLRAGMFTKVDPKDVPDKKVLVVGGTYLYGDMQKRVVEYNKTSDEYRIVLRDYSSYNSYDDYNAGYTQLNNDIIAGNMPDILVVDSYNMNIENYANKGLLADVGELIKKDETLSQTAFAENVFEACKINGKLYEVIPSYYVSTYMAKKSLVGDRSGWNMAEAEEFMKSMPDADLFCNMTRGEFINNVMRFCGAEFIDVASGKCKFDSPEFISLMEYAKWLPEEIGDENYTEDWYAAYESQYRENRTILLSYSINEFSDMVYAINGNLGEDASFVGFPSEDKNGSIIYTNSSYALSAKSANMDAAWNFVRYYLEDEYQSNLQWQLPVNVKYLQEHAEKATKKPVYNYEGVETEEDYVWWINEEQVILDPLTKEQADTIVNLVTNVKKRAYQNEEVTKIVTEEMGSFFSGQKSAQDVAKVIQSRVQLYVNENR